jgi:alpha-mannosidase
MARIPLAYTFGNHMHWTDMEWLWGYDVLPGSTDDMLAFCRDRGIRGGVNFDGIGYEKMAAESPEHLAKLRDAIRSGMVEVVGGSYGQPYGLFHGGESNIRQRIHGIRAAMRLFGVRPTTFWEEEFDFFPQLPQILAGCGFRGAALYFQWTWHTPEIPKEDAPVVAWTAPDGTSLPAATRNRLNLHQWPEDFRILLDDLAANPPETGDGPPPLVLQWLELMPTQDWMCRSELMSPLLREFQEDPRFEVLPTTLGDYLAQWKERELPVRKYSPDQVWHGMTLGKYGDRHPKMSAHLEHSLLQAETAAAILGLFGRPYEPWDVYPTWEIEDAWRKVLAAQHHDNHECQGLCGHVAEGQFGYAEILMGHSDPVRRLARRVGSAEGEEVVFNRLGWEVDGVPGMGYRRRPVPEDPEPRWLLDGLKARYQDARMKIEMDLASGDILLAADGEEARVKVGLEFGGQRLGLDRQPSILEDDESVLVLLGPEGAGSLSFTPLPDRGELEVFASVETENCPLAPGYAGAAYIVWEFDEPLGVLRADGPYHMHEVLSGSKGQRKYPEGDWMTSPQWFESVEGAFTSQSVVLTPSLRIAHGGNQGWFREERRLRTVILAEDPWDEGKGPRDANAVFRLRPHRGESNAQALRGAARLWGRHPDVWNRALARDASATEANPAMPDDFCACRVDSPHVLATAFYREQSSFAAKGLATYAMPDVLHPYLLRLVEVDGVGGDVELTLPGPIARASKTNLMGELIRDLPVESADPGALTTQPKKLESFGITACKVRVEMRPYEIATVMLDIVPGRKQFRDLDAKREIWATVHRVDPD